jgi:uncharacterized membrane-anchored protein YjiN (DUF445 family)
MPYSIKFIFQKQFKPPKPLINMPEEQQQDQISFLLSDFNARLRDTEEKNRVLKERILILGKNILNLKDQVDSSIGAMKEEVNQFRKEISNIKNLLENLVSESNSFVRQDEIAMVERMLKDFYPLDFARIKDTEWIIENKINQLKEKIKSDLQLEIKDAANNLEVDKIIEQRILNLKHQIDREIENKLDKIHEAKKSEYKINEIKNNPIASEEHKNIAEEKKKLHEHINHTMSHLTHETILKHKPNKSKKVKNHKK